MPFLLAVSQLLSSIMPFFLVEKPLVRKTLVSESPHTVSFPRHIWAFELICPWTEDMQHPTAQQASTYLSSTYVDEHSKTLWHSHFIVDGNYLFLELNEFSRTKTVLKNHFARSIPCLLYCYTADPINMNDNVSGQIRCSTEWHHRQIDSMQRGRHEYNSAQEQATNNNIVSAP